MPFFKKIAQGFLFFLVTFLMLYSCQNDTKEYSRLRTEMTLSEFTEQHMKCSHYCLWFAWFHRQRQKIVSENIKPVPDKKEAPKTKSKK